ncbi:D-tyrosyl-tRNA(Tyr) deacylase [Candidatus Gottesmanbacteria bacterium RIFCSPHIGHO2_01_FULL_39_10]|uniref:D-aminoacyl-tRNA deacylase n=1 Tax=Candidatus Gottesmanbacteria bacterium RIFCSPHIGHO2_01_FULL_39_10 TaxID=1798375 RepID=A0A1F5ZPX3_9BACT|nr:MAG: D-tyrosyl-tRNA(Tyr) deacylase [Candidatus Gottesmanbacteria bacterium RIFCSPHIGHO2_01_FULL_39_10]
MRALLQRVSSGKVSLPAGRQGINTKVVGEIGKGYVILLGVKEGDSEKEADLLAEKVVNLRVMSDKENKMNLAIKDVEGEILVVSQFTLYADLSAGRRPSFVHAAKPEVAKKLYEYFIAKLKSLGIKNVQTGEFGAYMEVVIVNDGPVTIMMDSEEK